MAPAALLTPTTSGTNTPTAASELTSAGIKHVQAALNQAPQIAPLDASRLTVSSSTSPRSVPAPGDPEIKAQRVCTDHMVTARWTLANGWDAPEMKPYGPLAIMPNASVLHYATECFEGLKLYRGFDGKLRLFRVDRNCERLRRSAARIALPDFDAVELKKLIIALCARDGAKWLPKDQPGSFLYLRPNFIGSDAALGVQRPNEALLYVILALFPDMSKSLAPVPVKLSGQTNGATTSVAGLKLLASNEDTIRAWPGGFGFAKVGANYGPSLVAQGEARSRGFDQVLWLFGEDCSVTEAGASNLFVVWKNKSGKTELVTAPLEERIILEGITRASILELAKERLASNYDNLSAVEVVERKFTMADLISAYEEDRLVEVFAAGTAFFVAPVGLIHFRGRDLLVPMDGDTGKYARVLKQWLSDIMYGNEKHAWAVVVDEESS